MNKELQVMIYTAFAILAILLIIVNIYSLSSNHYLSDASISSQQVAVNRLKRPHLKRASEVGKYPQLKKQKRLQLLAVRQSNRLYVISNHKVIYVVNAGINLQPTTTAINAARGEQASHVNNSNQSIANSWLSFGQLGYIESPVSINGKRVHGNWIKNKYHLPNTIEVSRPDAKWLQQVPKDTKLIIR